MRSMPTSRAATRRCATRPASISASRCRSSRIRAPTRGRSRRWRGSRGDLGVFRLDRAPAGAWWRSSRPDARPRSSPACPSSSAPAIRPATPVFVDLQAARADAAVRDVVPLRGAARALARTRPRGARRLGGEIVAQRRRRERPVAAASRLPVALGATPRSERRRAGRARALGELAEVGGHAAPFPREIAPEAAAERRPAIAALPEDHDSARPVPAPASCEIEAYVPRQERSAGRAPRSTSSRRTRRRSARARGDRGAIAQRAEQLELYPDGRRPALREAIGAHYGLDPGPHRLRHGLGRDLGAARPRLSRAGRRGRSSRQHGFLVYSIAILAGRRRRRSWRRRRDSRPTSTRSSPR